MITLTWKKYRRVSFSEFVMYNVVIINHYQIGKGNIRGGEEEKRETEENEIQEVSRAARDACYYCSSTHMTIDW